MDSALKQITERARMLTPEQQQDVLAFLYALEASPRASTPPGTPGRELMHLAGAFSKDDAQEMVRMIEKDCETVDPDGW